MSETGSTETLGLLPSLARVRGTTHRVSAGHFGQHLRQVRERHGDIGQVLGHGVVHDAEELRRARRGVDLARPEVPKHVAADHDGDLQPLFKLHLYTDIEAYSAFSGAAALLVALALSAALRGSAALLAKPSQAKLELS